MGMLLLELRKALWSPLQATISMRKAMVKGQKSAKAAPVPGWGRGGLDWSVPRNKFGKKGGKGKAPGWQMLYGT